MDNEVEVITSESGDWTIIKLNGEIIEEGHSIPASGWINLLEMLDVKTSIKEISDEAMESGEF